MVGQPSAQMRWPADSVSDRDSLTTGHMKVSHEGLSLLLPIASSNAGGSNRPVPVEPGLAWGAQERAREARWLRALALDT